MSFPEPLKLALQDLKFKQPTEVQGKTIPVSLTGRDLMVCAETGSGKTAAFGIPIVSAVLANPERQAVVLAPTRELAQQIGDVLESLTKHAPQVRTVNLVGGTDIRRQLKVLQRGPQIVIATPGRLMDHLKRKSVNLSKTAVLVLDEGDRMIDMGFAPQLEAILKHLPKKRQTLFFTATLPNKVKKLAEQYLFQPEMVVIGQGSKPVQRIKQSVLKTTADNKNSVLMDELNHRKGSVIIFTRTKSRTDRLAKVLGQYGYKVSRIHGGRTQGQRNQAIQGFRDGQFRILCATDVAARGIDVPHVEHVINYDLPMMVEDYVHRIGRTGRNGAEGEALNLVVPQEINAWNALVKKYQIPTGQLEKDRSAPQARSVNGRSSHGGGGGASQGRPQNKRSRFKPKKKGRRF